MPEQIFHMKAHRRVKEPRKSQAHLIGLNIRRHSGNWSTDIKRHKRVTERINDREASDKMLSLELIHVVCRSAGPTDRGFEETGLAVHDPDRTPLRKHFSEYMSCERSFSRSRAPLYKPMAGSVFESQPNGNLTTERVFRGA